MTLSSILVFLLFGILFRLFARGRGRGWGLFVASALAVYWLQPATPVRSLDFWFPTLTLGLAVLGWVLTAPPEGRAWRANAPAAAVLVGVVVLVACTRFLEASGVIIPSRPPAIEQAAAGLVVLAALAGLVSRLRLPNPLLWLVIGLLVALLAVLKSPPLAQAASAWLRGLMNQSTSLAAATDLRWLGFSYLAFRLIHTLRERQNGRLPAVSLQEYLVYVVFFPAFTAGPIDRLDRFIKDLRGPSGTAPARPARAGAAVSSAAAQAAPPAPPALLTAAPGEAKLLAVGAGGAEGARLLAVGSGGKSDSASPFRTDIVLRFMQHVSRLFTPQDAGVWAAAGQRLALGLLKKFVVADGLALVALNATNAAQVEGAGWTWLLLYAYSLQIYFDFSGYTDIAIGLGRLLGISLPENFNAPYLKPNLTQFWSNWHMTLTNWFRAYYFNPVTRWLRTVKIPYPPAPSPAGEGEEEISRGLPPAFIIFFTQLSTMVLIGLWHGATWNFVLWGAWHGLGQFIQNRFSEWMRPRYAALETRPRLHAAVTGLTTLVTFHYVALGWVFFALPDVGLAGQVFRKLLGF